MARRKCLATLFLEINMNEIVTAVAFRDSVFIFCKDGKVFQMYYNELHGKINFVLMHKLFPERSEA